MKNVIFDFGNVLIRWRPYNALHEHFGSEEEMHACFDDIDFFAWNAEQDRGRSWAEGIAWAKNNHPSKVHIFQAYIDGLGPAHSEQIEGVTEIIDRLDDRGVALFGLTNAAEASFEAVKTTAPVINKMRDVLVSAREGLIKPSAEVFELCLTRNAINASETLFVDDSAANCLGAEQVGIVPHLFTDAETLETHLIDLKLL